MFPPCGESWAVVREDKEEEVREKPRWRVGEWSGPALQLLLGPTTFFLHGTPQYSYHKSPFFG